MATVLVTGGNRGIGLELCTQYHERGDHVICACRHTTPALSEIGIRVIENVDVADDNGVAHLVEELDGEAIDILLNNAGILMSDNIDSVDFDSMLEQFRVNAIGPLRTTRALKTNLRQGSKVGIVTSRVGSLEDNSSGNNYGYRSSKAAANMIGVNLSHDLRSAGVAVALLHPGLVATDMTGGTGIPANEAARNLIARMDDLNLENSGSFWHAEGYALPW